jgi:hypothetical protein
LHGIIAAQSFPKGWQAAFATAKFQNPPIFLNPPIFRNPDFFSSPHIFATKPPHRGSNWHLGGRPVTFP